MRPIVTLVFFDTIAATISVPPVLPLCMNASPTPSPHIIEPRMIFING